MPSEHQTRADEVPPPVNEQDELSTEELAELAGGAKTAISGQPDLNSSQTTTFQETSDQQNIQQYQQSNL
ncbi:MAG: hypothetical protein OXS30_08010 [Chloroflexota bacterium]|nr:hypothetical protein [Chloroflexota bacterium]